MTSQTDPKTEWLTAAEAAHYLRIKDRTLLLWARQGKVKGYALSGTKRHVWRFRQADLDATLLDQTVMVNCDPLSVRSSQRRAE
jgi:excisionase family DNA binding protein